MKTLRLLIAQTSLCPCDRNPNTDFMRPLRLFIARAFLRHCEQHHNADYEACPDRWCQVAYWLERRLWRWLYGMEVA